MKKIIMTLAIFSFLIGCQSDNLDQSKTSITNSHKEFLSSYDWEIERNHSFHYYGLIPNEGISEMSLYQEYINDINEFGGVNLNPYLDTPITETGYVLKNTVNFHFIPPENPMKFSDWLRKNPVLLQNNVLIFLHIMWGSFYYDYT